MPGLSKRLPVIRRDGKGTPAAPLNRTGKGIADPKIEDRSKPVISERIGDKRG